jgi:hypothetical protein
MKNVAIKCLVNSESIKNCANKTVSFHEISVKTGALQNEYHNLSPTAGLSVLEFKLNN